MTHTIYYYVGNDYYKKINIKSTLVEFKNSKCKSIIKHYDKINLIQQFDHDDRKNTPECTSAADAIKRTNINTFHKTISCLIYNVSSISIQNLPIANQNHSFYDRFMNNFKRCSKIARVRLYLAGLNARPRNITDGDKYECNVCGVVIMGQLNEHPIFDHLIHNIHCVYVKLTNDIEHVYSVHGDIILYENIIADVIVHCTICNVRPAGVLCMDCGHVDSCKSCFLSTRTCVSCDLETTEFCILNYSSAILDKPVYNKSETINISDMSDVHETQNYYVNIPCMHVSSSRMETSFCESCMTSLFGVIPFKFAFRGHGIDDKNSDKTSLII